MKKNKFMFYSLFVALCLAGCAGTNEQQYAPIETPTVDYVEQLDVYSAPHRDSFLNQLAMNYRSYAIYNARQSGYSEMGELFANKAVSAFSGEIPFPETLENWPIDDNATEYELRDAYNGLMSALQNDAADDNPVVAAEAQAKYDCWLSATATNQMATAVECHDRFIKSMAALDCDGESVREKVVARKEVVRKPKIMAYYPQTREIMRTSVRPREGVIVVNNVSIPEHLITPQPVGAPMMFNQNIYGNDGEVAGGDDVVSRGEFIEMMTALRDEFAIINARLDAIEGERTMIKVQQIPLEPKQHVMEEIFEVQFDFDKSIIKPEYEELIRKLVSATNENKNIKVSVVGHTDTSGSKAYNYALGGKRAKAVQNMLIKYGIPSSQIVSVSAGEEDLKIKTGDGVPKAANRRVQVIKETHSIEQPEPLTEFRFEEVVVKECGEYGCAS